MYIALFPLFSVIFSYRINNLITAIRKKENIPVEISLSLLTLVIAVILFLL